MPVLLTEISICNVALNSNEVIYLKTVKVLIIDDTSMILYYALHAIDKFLWDIKRVDAFGGKVIMLEGNLR